MKVTVGWKVFVIAGRVLRRGVEFGLLTRIDLALTLLRMNVSACEVSGCSSVEGRSSAFDEDGW